MVVPGALHHAVDEANAVSWEANVRKGCAAVCGQVAILAAKALARAAAGRRAATADAGTPPPPPGGRWDEADAVPLLQVLPLVFSPASKLYATADAAARTDWVPPPRLHAFAGEERRAARRTREESYWLAIWPYGFWGGAPPGIYGQPDTNPAALRWAKPAVRAFVGVGGLAALAAVLRAPAGGGGGPSWRLRALAARVAARLAPVLAPAYLEGSILAPAGALLRAAASAAAAAGVARPPGPGVPTTAPPPSDPLAGLCDGPADKGCAHFEEAVAEGLAALGAGVKALALAAEGELHGAEGDHPHALPRAIACSLAGAATHGYAAAVEARTSLITAILGPAEAGEEEGEVPGGGVAPRPARSPPSLVRGVAAARISAALVGSAGLAEALGSFLLQRSPSLYEPEQFRHHDALATPRTEAAVAWLRSHSVLARLLRANLHHRDHTAAVGALLRSAAPAGGVDDAVLDALWSAAILSPDVVPDERAGARGLLAAAVSALPEEQRADLQARVRSVAEAGGGGGGGGAGAGAAGEDARGPTTRTLDFLSATAAADTAGALARFVMGEAMHLAIGVGEGQAGADAPDPASAAALAAAREAELDGRGEGEPLPWEEVPLAALIGWRRAAAVDTVNAAAAAYKRLPGALEATAMGGRGVVWAQVVDAAKAVWPAGGVPGHTDARASAAAGAPPRPLAARLAAAAVAAALLDHFPGGNARKASACANTRVANLLAFPAAHLGNWGCADLVDACVGDALAAAGAADAEAGADACTSPGTASSAAPTPLPLAAAAGVARAAAALACHRRLVFPTTRFMSTSGLLRLWDAATGAAREGGAGPAVAAARAALADVARAAVVGLQTDGSISTRDGLDALLCGRLCADGSGGRPPHPVLTATTVQEAGEDESQDQAVGWAPPSQAAAAAAARVAASDLGGSAWALFLACFEAVGLDGDHATSARKGPALELPPVDLAVGKARGDNRTRRLRDVAGLDQMWLFATASPDGAVRADAATRLVTLYTCLATPTGWATGAEAVARVHTEMRAAAKAAGDMFEECVSRLDRHLPLLQLDGGRAGGGEGGQGGALEDEEAGPSPPPSTAAAAERAVAAHLGILACLARTCNTAAAPTLRPHATAGRGGRMVVTAAQFGSPAVRASLALHTASTVADLTFRFATALGREVVPDPASLVLSVAAPSKPLGPPGYVPGHALHGTYLTFPPKPTYVTPGLAAAPAAPTPAAIGRAACPAKAASEHGPFLQNLLRLADAPGMGRAPLRAAVKALDALPTLASLRAALKQALEAGAEGGGGAGEETGEGTPAMHALLQQAASAGPAAAMYMVEALHELLFPAGLEVPVERGDEEEEEEEVAARGEAEAATRALRLGALRADLPATVLTFAEGMTPAGSGVGLPAVRLRLAAVRLAASLLFEVAGPGPADPPPAALVPDAEAMFAAAGGGGGSDAARPPDLRRAAVLATLARMALRSVALAAADAWGAGWKAWDEVTAAAGSSPGSALVSEAGDAAVAAASLCPPLAATLADGASPAGRELAAATRASLTCAGPGEAGRQVRKWALRAPVGGLVRSVLPRPAAWVSLLGVLGAAAPWAGGEAALAAADAAADVDIAAVVAHALTTTCAALAAAPLAAQAATRPAAEACLGAALAAAVPPSVFRCGGGGSGGGEEWRAPPTRLLAGALSAAAALVGLLGVGGGGGGEGAPASGPPALALASSAPALVSYLLRCLLFPEAALLARARGAGGGSDTGTDLAGALGGHAGITAAVRSPAAAAPVRAAALALASSLADADPGSAAAAATALTDLHCPPPGVPRLDDSPDAARGPGSAGTPPLVPSLRPPGRPAGLANAAATCYMNAVIQVMCARPAVRAALLASAAAGPLPGPDELKAAAAVAPSPPPGGGIGPALPPPPPPTGADSVAHQLAVVFGHLSLGSRAEHRPEAFWKSLRDVDGEAVNLREHQDACEFFTRLLDGVDAEVAAAGDRAAAKAAAAVAAAAVDPGGTNTVPSSQQTTNAAGGPSATPAPCRDPARKPLEACLGGALVMRTTCRPGGHSSARTEPFAALSVDVMGKASLGASLAAYVAPEAMTGDNAVECEGCGGGRVDAARGARLARASLPGTLAIHLKRFEFDTRTYERYKITSRYEFPDDLDLVPYVEEEGGEGEAGGDGTHGRVPRVSTKYRLVGVVVHSGTAHAGHYYALLALSGPDAAALDAATGRRDGASSSSSSSSSSAPPADNRRWFKYDDGAVTPWSLADLDQSCFGGRSATKLLAGVDRPYSAYMLFYERVDGTEEEAQAADDGGGLAQMETAPPAPGPPAAWWAPPPAGLATLPIPCRPGYRRPGPAGCPAERPPGGRGGRPGVRPGPPRLCEGPGRAGGRRGLPQAAPPVIGDGGVGDARVDHAAAAAAAAGWRGVR